MNRFIYVYILRSRSTPDRFYAGLTADLRSRLQAHNNGKVVHTSKFAHRFHRISAGPPVVLSRLQKS
jgi:predicted GIY-YIG superfamily endonuclease